MTKTTVLVTGATGRIGRYVVRDLLNKGFDVRAMTTNGDRARTVLGEHPNLELIEQDWLREIDFSEALTNAGAVLHLGAEIWRLDRMERLNIEVTQQLALAAQRAGVNAFVFASSIAVYGSQKSTIATEDSPRLTATADIRNEYRASVNLRSYGRSKVTAENVLRETFDGQTCSIVRPTVVVDNDQIQQAIDDAGLKARLGQGRLTHFVYVEDVSAAMIWLMEQHLDGALSFETVQCYNVSDPVGERLTHKSLQSGRLDENTLSRPSQQGSIEKLTLNLIDMAKTKNLSLRKPFGLTRFPSDKLAKLGFVAPHGLIKVLSDCRSRAGR
ncbi:MAG: NAD-dependent epimerase/dehydratase family protein [Pseudomonadota bacterium]